MRLIPFPDEKRPLVFAHRGLSSEEPENTMASFGAARAAGIPGIELDVHLTRDGRLAVIHDDSTRRTAGTTGTSGAPEPEFRIEECDWATIASLDAGSWKNPARSKERIPQLRDLFEEFGASFYYDIELKTRAVSGGALESAVAACIHDAGLEERCAVSSFNPLSLRRFKAISPRVPTAIIWSRSAELYAYLRHGEGRWLGDTDYLKPEHVLVQRHPSRARASLRKALGLPAPRPIAAWTVDESAEAARLIALGCLGIVSNAPHRLGIRI